MFLSLNWLKKYVDLPKGLSVDKLVYDLTMSTAEVEGYHEQAKSFDKMVVGKVVELKSHPNADKLKIAMTDIGKDNLVQIVCGGENLREGMWVMVTLPGAKVKWHGQGELIELKETEIRGEKSFGMIAASTEIGLGDIFPCPDRQVTDISHLKGLKVGQSLAKVLGMNDTIIEIENKIITNRPDLWNHYGFARELAAIYGVPLKKMELYNTKIHKAQKTQKTQLLNIKIDDKKLCSRYMGCVITNIKIEESPEWLKKELRSAGMRPINNIVDITNHVMLDVGEPMHAFNIKALKHKSIKTEIVIRYAKHGEKIMTLDGIERKLEENMLVIADAEKPIAIAGVMGGKETEVDEKTTGIILEAANFHDMSIRKTSQRLSLRTEASQRFEKKLDSNFVESGMLRALKLIKDLIPGCVIEGLVDANYFQPKATKIIVEHEFLEKRIGQEFKKEEIVNILKRLGFVVNTENTESIKTQKHKNTKNTKTQRNLVYNIIVPSWRATGDVSISEDIVEEVARIYGYEKIKADLPEAKIVQVKFNRELELEKLVREFLTLGSGMNEVYNHSFTSKYMMISADKDSANQFIKLKNPLSEELKFLRNGLIFGLLKNVVDNLRYYKTFKLFEFGRIFLDKEGELKVGGQINRCLPDQPKMLSGAVVIEKDKDVFHELKGIVEGMGKLFHCSIVPLLNTNKFVDEKVGMSIKMGEEEVGWFGEASAEIYKNFGFSAQGGSTSGGKNKKVGLFEINFSRLIKIVETQHVASSNDVKYQPLPQYPGMERDIALEVDHQIEWDKIKNIVEQFDPLILRVEFLSVFDLEDKQKKSLAFRIFYQSNEKTLTSAEVDEIQNKLVAKLEQETGGVLRK